MAFGITSGARADTLERGWTGEQVDRGERVIDLAVVGPEPGTRAALYNVSRSPSRPEVRSRLDRLGEPERSQILDQESFFPAADASPLGGVVAAWYTEDLQQLRVSELPPGGSQFGPAQSAPATGGNFSYGRPLVRVSEAGDAIVVYLARWSGGQAIFARHRPAGGAFGAPELVAGPAETDALYPRDAALGPDGTAGVAFVDHGRAAIATRPPGGAFGTPEVLGEPLPEHSWQSPRLGIDAAGNVVAAWLEGAPINDTGPVKVAFRHPGGRFSAPLTTGLRATDYGRIGLGVSLAGEVVLMVEASTTNPYGGTHIEGIHAVMGNASVAAIGAARALTGIWGHYPSFAMNGRGDALVVWDECCPMALRARRRPPLGGFGDVEEVQPPIELEGSRSGRWALDADIDTFGNGHAAWLDGEPDPYETFVGSDAPLIDTEPPEVPPLEDFIAPVLEGTPDAAVPRAGTPPPVPPVDPRRILSRGDTTLPRLSLKARRRVAGGRRPRAVALLRCSELCAVRVEGTVAGARARPTDAIVGPGRTVRMGLPVPRRTASRVARAAARAGGRVRIRLWGVAVDAAGNVGRASVRSGFR